MLIYLILYIIAGRNQVKLWKRYPYSFHVLFSGKAFPYIAHKKNIERPFCSIWIFDGRIWQNIYSLIMLQQGCMKFASYWQGFPSIPCWTKCQWWTFATLDILKNVRGDNVLFQRASWPWCKSYGEWCVLHKMLAGQKQKHKNEFFWISFRCLASCHSSFSLCFYVITKSGGDSFTFLKIFTNIYRKTFTKVGKV